MQSEAEKRTGNILVHNSQHRVLLPMRPVPVDRQPKANPPGPGTSVPVLRQQAAPADSAAAGDNASCRLPRSTGWESSPRWNCTASGTGRTAAAPYIADTALAYGRLES